MVCEVSGGEWMASVDFEVDLSALAVLSMMVVFRGAIDMREDVQAGSSAKTVEVL